MTTPFVNPGQILMGIAPPPNPQFGPNPFFSLGNVQAYGADPTGVRDSTAAINECIAACTQAGLPALTQQRSLLSPIIFPPGTYLVSSDLNFKSMVNPYVFGYGATIVASGSGFTNSIFNIDGSYRGIWAGFTIIGNGSENVPSAFKLNFTTAVERSTTGNTFRDLTIRNLNFVTGLDLSGTANRQVDGNNFDNILVAGLQSPATWSNTGFWQNGFLLGNSALGNEYDNYARALTCQGCYVGWNINGSSLVLDGAEPAQNFIDFQIVPAAQCSIRNVQSQNCNQFFSVQGFSPNPVSFQDCVIKSVDINANGYIGSIVGGPVRLSNMTWASCQIAGSGAYGSIVLRVTNDGSSSRYATVTADNICADSVKASAFSIAAASGNANIVLTNFMNYNTQTGVYTTAAGDLISYYTGTGWTTIA